jgi:hypothetical protein
LFLRRTMIMQSRLAATTCRYQIGERTDPQGLCRSPSTDPASLCRPQGDPLRTMFGAAVSCCRSDQVMVGVNSASIRFTGGTIEQRCWGEQIGH